MAYDTYRLGQEEPTISFQRWRVMMRKKNRWRWRRAWKIRERESHHPIRPECCSEENSLRNEDWWKITLYDENRSPLADGTICFFTDDIEDFQNRWFRLLGEDAQQRKNNFLRSKAGEIVTEWYGDNPADNIVQREHAASYKQKTVVLENINFQATNTCEWESNFHAGRWGIDFRWIIFQGKHYRIASFRADGVCRKRIFPGIPWESITCFGNPVLENTAPFNPMAWEKEECRVENFADNKLETICFLVSEEFKNKKLFRRDMKRFRVTGEVLDRLFADVVGEAG